MAKRKVDESRDRVARHYALQRAAGRARVSVWIPDTDAAKAALKRYARDLRLQAAVGDAPE